MARVTNPESPGAPIGLRSARQCRMKQGLAGSRRRRASQHRATETHADGRRRPAAEARRVRRRPGRVVARTSFRRCRPAGRATAALDSTTSLTRGAVEVCAPRPKVAGSEDEWRQRDRPRLRRSGQRARTSSRALASATSRVRTAQASDANPPRRPRVGDPPDRRAARTHSRASGNARHGDRDRRDALAPAAGRPVVQRSRGTSLLPALRRNPCRRQVVSVVVKVKDGNAFVLTAYLTDRIKQGVRLWPSEN
jgi:hypothetical protein